MKFHQETGDAVYFHFFAKLRATFHRTTTNVSRKAKVYISNYMQTGTNTSFAKVSKTFSSLFSISILNFFQCKRILLKINMDKNRKQTVLNMIVKKALKL